MTVCVIHEGTKLHNMLLMLLGFKQKKKLSWKMLSRILILSYYVTFVITDLQINTQEHMYQKK